MKIEVRGITKRFGRFVALDNVTLEVASGELVALLGPSGCGKTTLLRILSGLEFADAGSILLDGVDAAGETVGGRRVGFVFQHYALFRHMTVFENIAFGLRARRGHRLARMEIAGRVNRLLGLIKMENLADRYPAQLSGGQRQRVALARALAVEPRALLLDEPFGALDANVRKELRRWLRRLHDELHVTSVFVTHDVEEALEVADRIVVMRGGRVEQVGRPDEVYEQPASPFVFRFLGGAAVFPMRGPAGEAMEQPPSQKAGWALVRPHDVELFRTGDVAGAVEALVECVQPIGAIVRIVLRPTASGEAIEAELSRPRFRELGPRQGERLFARPADGRAMTWPVGARSGAV